MAEQDRYWQCDKCGAISTGNAGCCPMPMSIRTSGICAGGFTIELTKEEYDELINKYNKNRECPGTIE